MKILIVEDVAVNRTVAAQALVGHVVVFATNYREAVEALQDIDIEGVITDIFFPESAEEEISIQGQNLRVELLSRALKKDTRGKPHYQNERCAPLGLYILTECWRRNIPVIAFSDGNRHRGSLGAVRYGLLEYPEGERIDPVIQGWFVADGGDLPYEASDVDKTVADNWLRAYDKMISNDEDLHREWHEEGLLFISKEYYKEHPLLRRPIS